MWLACPASVTKTKDMLRPSSKYAREGTAAHSVAEMTLKGDIFLPDKVTVEGEEFIVSPGMCRALNQYISYVQVLMKLPHSRIFLEHRLQVPGTHDMVWGTLDCGVVTSRQIFVADLKYGKGHVVEPSSPQLKLYALGLAHQVGAESPDVGLLLTICQPRAGCEPLRHHAMTLGELWQWCDIEVIPAIRRIKAGDTTENAGPHCRWCVRKTECAAFARKHQTYATAVFDDMGDIL
jgi:hypothetical protein